MFDQPSELDPSTDRRMQRLARSASDLAAGAPTVRELGRRLTDDPEVLLPHNILQPPGDPIRHAKVDLTAAHGGIIPAP